LRKARFLVLLLAIAFGTTAVFVTATPPQTQAVTSTSVNGDFTVLLWNSTSASWTMSNVTTPIVQPPRTSTFNQNLTFKFSEGTYVTSTWSLGRDVNYTSTWLNASRTQTFVDSTGFTYTYPATNANITFVTSSGALFTAECGAWNDGYAQVGSTITQCGSFVLVPEFNGDLAMWIVMFGLLAIAAVLVWVEKRQKKGGDVQT
jgi:hypothetical protein